MNRKRPADVAFVKAAHERPGIDGNVMFAICVSRAEVLNRLGELTRMIAYARNDNV